MNENNNEIEEAWEKAWAVARNAVNTKDTPKLEAATKWILEVQGMRNQVAAYKERIRAVDPNTGPILQPKEPQLREILIEVTPGMINQNLLTLTKAIKEGKVKHREVFTIEALPSQRKFKTILIGGGNRLRERGEIGRFYRKAEVKPGNYVLLKEIAPEQWQLSKPEFRGGLPERGGSAGSGERVAEQGDQPGDIVFLQEDAKER